MTFNRTIRLIGVSLALVVLLIFATGVVSDWHHQGFSNDVHCPYCHLGHQAPLQLQFIPPSLALKPIASLPLPEDIVLAIGPICSQTAPRAPPAL